MPVDAVDLAGAALDWFERRTFPPSSLPDDRLISAWKRARGTRVSVVIPAVNEAATIGAICRIVRRDLMDGLDLVDELIVVDGGSEDGTAGMARRAGARVVDLAELIPDITPLAGKGEALWRSLSIASGDVVVWIDADIRNFAAHFVTRLIAPLLTDPSIDFVKAFYRRPIAVGPVVLPAGGGRVTELLARPLLASLFPELGGFVQPLAGEYAGRRDLLVRLPFFTGYSVEVGLLIDILDAAGLGAMAQVDIGERVHRNRPLHELAPMAHAIGRTILRRAEERGRIRVSLDYPTAPLLLPHGGALEERHVFELERPPLDLLPVCLDAARSAEELEPPQATLRA